MPKIAVVTSYFPTREQPYRGHSAYQTLRHLSAWADIEVYVPFAVYPRWLTPRSFPYFRPDTSYTPADMRARYFEYPALPLVSRFLNGYTCGRYLQPYLERSRPDLILNYWIYPDGYAAVSAGRALNIPVVLCAIGSDLCRIPDSTTRVLTGKALRGASFVITVSEDLRRRALELGAAPERTRAVINGCDPAVFQLRDRAAARAELGLDAASEIVLYAGRLDAKKGLRELVSAFAAMAASRPELQLVLLGEGLMRDELCRQANAVGLQRRIQLPGACDTRGVARWMTAADVFCLPSYSEGCPNVLIEALACGRPVVSTPVGGIPELVTSDCGILAPARDSGQLRAALSEALTRPWDRSAIARKFSRGWDMVARETYDICRALLAPKTAATRPRRLDSAVVRGA